MLSLDKVGQEQLDAWKSDIDLGDIVSVTGEVITSKRGELSILATEFALASKALRPLPVEHKELNEETRVRQRYVDLIVRPQAREMARIRPQVMNSLRKTFAAQDFLEVETPMLHSKNRINHRNTISSSVNNSRSNRCNICNVWC